MRVRRTREQVATVKAIPGRTAVDRKAERKGDIVPMPRSAPKPIIIATDSAPPNLQTTRPGNYLHVSDLIHRCMRKRAIHDARETQPPPRVLTMSDMLTFSQGDAIHDLLKDRVRLGWPDKMWGVWSCKCETLMHEEPCTFAEIDQEEECPHCLSRVTKYHEVPIFNDEYGIVGNPDVLLKFPKEGAFFVSELKSIADNSWQELRRPLPDHVLQVLMYWFLMREKGYRMFDKVGVAYASKAWKFGNTQPLKEFLIEPEKELHKIEPLLEDALAYKNHRGGGKLPPRIVCSSSASKEAKTCEVKEVCFSCR